MDNSEIKGRRGHFAVPFPIIVVNKLIFCNAVVKYEQVDGNSMGTTLHLTMVHIRKYLVQS